MNTTIEETTEIPHCRRFSLGDVMILIAAAAVWLWISLGFVSPIRELLERLPFGRLSGWSSWWVCLTQTEWEVTLALLIYANNIALAFLLATSPAFLIMRLRRPRPPLAQLALQPGMVAFEAMSLTVLRSVFIQMTHPTLNRLRIVSIFLPLPLAWGALILTDRWRREPGWIDRLGVWLGVGWGLESGVQVWWLFRSLAN